MVVPVARALPSQSKNFIGNNLNLNIDENVNGISLTGNNCKVILEENRASVHVVGNNCEIVVLKGNGSIEYIGNRGKIYLGTGMSSKNVNYIGNQGNVTYLSENITVQDDLKKSYYYEPSVVECCDAKKKPLNISNAKKIRVSSTSHIPHNFEMVLPIIRGNVRK